MALEQGKDVLVLPGRITDSLSSGCNRLIKQGAGIFTSMDDIFQALKVEQVNGALERKLSLTREGKGEIEEKNRLYQILDFMPKSIERIWEEYGNDKISLQQLMQELLELCLKGKAQQIGGNYVKK